MRRLGEAVQKADGHRFHLLALDFSDHPLDPRLIERDQHFAAGINALGNFAALRILQGADYLKVFEPRQLQALAFLCLDLHGHGFGISLVFFGFTLFLLGYLIFNSGYFPKTLGVLLTIASLCYLTNSFALFCTPVINLFPKRLDPILISDRFSEFHIVPERTRPIDFEIYQIQSVVGILARVNEEQRFEPFYLARDSEGRSGAYYTVNRVPRVLTAKEKKFGAVSSYAGSEVFISLVDSEVAPYKRQLSQLSITALCTNRHLPIQLPISVGESDLVTELYSPVASVRWVAVPTVPIASTAEGDPSWRIISHLSLNYLSLLDAKDGEGAVALRDLLKLYVNPNDVFTLRQIDGIRSIASAPIVQRVVGPGPLTFARGLEVRISLDEEAFEGSGIFILGAVLAHFFARYVSINSFTETVIVSQRRGEVMRWPSQIGKRQIA